MLYYTTILYYTIQKDPKAESEAETRIPTLAKFPWGTHGVGEESCMPTEVGDGSDRVVNLLLSDSPEEDLG